MGKTEILSTEYVFLYKIIKCLKIKTLKFFYLVCPCAFTRHDINLKYFAFLFVKVGVIIIYLCGLCNCHYIGVKTL